MVFPSVRSINHLIKWFCLYPKLIPSQRLLSSNSPNLSQVEIGQSAQLQRTFTSADVAHFAKLSQDFNALHLDDSFAALFQFDKAIVHGALINGTISATIGTILPGPGSILLEQELHFPNPLYVGEQFVSKVTIANKKRNIYFCKYECVTDSGKIVVKGMAKVLFRPAKLPE